jgi:hypothetical protein
MPKDRPSGARTGMRAAWNRFSLCDTPRMLNLNLLPTLLFVFSFLFLYFAVRLGVHHGMRDFTRSQAKR